MALTNRWGGTISKPRGGNIPQEQVQDAIFTAIFLVFNRQILAKSKVKLVFIKQHLTLNVTVCAKKCYMCGEVIARHVVFSSPSHFLLCHVLIQGNKNAPISLT